MKWEGLNLHIENLAPGVVMLVLVLAMLPKTILDDVGPSAAGPLLGDPFFAAGVFVAASYLVGIFTVTICRCIIDTTCAPWLRPQLFKLFDRDKQLVGKTPKEINHRYHDARQAALSTDSDEYKRTEIKNRRERVRLLRSGILPMAFVVWWVAGDIPVWAKILIEFGALTVSLFLYVYMEFAVYQECRLGQAK